MLLRNLIRRSFTAKQKIFLAAHGRDRIGIVKDITSLILDQGGNVLDSQMTRLSAFFSVIMMVNIPQTQADILLQKLKQDTLLQDLSISAKLIPSGISDVASERTYRYNFKVEGADNPGIVHSFTEYISSQGINIESCQSSTEDAPMGGSKLFKLQGIIQIPEIVDFEKLKLKLEDLSSDLGVQINIV